MSNETLEVSAPWVEFSRFLYVLFSEDPEINIVYDNEACEVKLYVANETKAAALEKKLPTEKTWGNVTLKITVIPANVEEKDIDIFRKIFAGNPVLSDIVTVDNILAGGFSYVGFANRVAQFFNDQLDDPYGLQSMLYEDVAREVFGETAGVFFYTDIPDEYQAGLAQPLGEWP